MIFYAEWSGLVIQKAQQSIFFFGVELSWAVCTISLNRKC
jgi:hypothetical protein